MKRTHWIMALCLLNLFISNSLAGPGALDSSFSPTLNGSVYAITTQADSRVLIAGTFTTVNGISRSRIARLFPDGSLDTGYLTNVSGASSTVWSMLVQPDGKVLIGGDFTTVNSQTRPRVARLNVNGSLDGTFNPSNGPNSTVNSLAIQNDGKILIGGLFTTVNSTNRNFIARLNADGSLDSTFNPSTGVTAPVNTLSVQSDGKVIIGGTFTTVFGLTRNRIARLLSDGSVDQNFQNGLVGASSTVRFVQVQSDGKILISGDFNTVNNVSRGKVARLLSDGSLDTGFNPNATSGFNNSIYALAVQGDGNIVAVGDFNNVNSFSRNRIARMYSDGTVDSSFLNGVAGANLLVRSVALQSDGKPLIGGEFLTINSSNRTQVARLYGDLYPPEIINQPLSRSTNVGATVTFTVNVNNPTPVNYQWRKEEVNIPGATLNSYTLINVQTGDAGNYSVFLSDGAGGTASSNAVLNVGISSAITAQPSSLMVTQGQSASFSVTATGMPLNYIWRKNGLPIASATNAIYIIPSVIGSDAATYTVVVSNFLNSVISTGALLTVYFPPTISLQPADQMVAVSSNFILSVTASGNPAVAYQWRKDSSPIQGATASAYTVTGAQTNDSGNYDVVITNSFGSVTSSVAAVNVGYAPVVIQQLQSLTNSLGGTAAFSCMITGSTPMNLQWLFNGGFLLGETNATLTLTNLQPRNIGFYALTAANAFGGTISSNAALNLNGYPFGIWHGLVAYYPFNGNANDAAGTNHGTVFGATPASDRFGNLNQAYYFDGTNSYIEIAPSTNVFGSQEFSVSMWFNPLTFPNPSIPSQAACFLISKGQNNFELATGSLTSAAGMHWLPRLASGNDWNTPASTYQTNVWQHVAAIYKPSTKTVQVFLNGISLVLTGPTNTTVGLDNSTPARLGLRTDGTLAFKGFLDSVRIYNRALSTNEIAQLYTIELGQPRIQLNENLGFASGQFGFEITGIPGESVVIEASEALPLWTPIATNVIGVEPLLFRDFSSTNFPTRFYRLRY